MAHIQYYTIRYLYLGDFDTSSSSIKEKHQPPNYPPFLMNNVQVTRFEQHKHLGIIVNQQRSWHHHIQEITGKAWKRLNILRAQFNFTYRYIDDVLSINNPDFDNDLGQMYPAELEIKDMTKSNTSASYLDLILWIESDGQLRTSLYDKRDDFNFHMTNFPFLSSNIPFLPAYGVLSHSSYGTPGLAPLMNVLF